MNKKNSKHESSFDLANKKTNSKEYADRKNILDKNKISNPIESLNITFGKSLDEKFEFKPNHEINNINTKDYELFQTQLKTDELNLKHEDKILGLNTLEGQYETYIEICKFLNLKTYDFKKINPKDNSKDEFINNLNLPYANSTLNIIMYSIKRTMLEIMKQIKEPIINLLTFYVFNMMMDLLEMKETILSNLSGKNIYEVMLKELTKNLDDEKEMEKRIENNILFNMNKNFNTKDINMLKTLQLKFAQDMVKVKDFVMKNFEQNTKDNMKLAELINMSKNVNYKTSAFISNLENRIEKLEQNLKKNKTQHVKLPNVVWKKFRQINARCQGLHDRIIDIEDYLNEDDIQSISKRSAKNGPKEKNDQFSEHESDEWEEIEDSQENSDTD